MSALHAALLVVPLPEQLTFKTSALHIFVHRLLREKRAAPTRVSGDAFGGPVQFEFLPYELHEFRIHRDLHAVAL